MSRNLLAASAVLTCLLSGPSVVAQQRPPAAHKITAQELAGWIDERLGADYARGGLAAPATVDDATFLRRAFLDLQGAIPAVAQVRDFLDETGSFKRADYVDRLL